MKSLENKKRTIAFIFQCSIEYRSLLLSGLYDKLKKNYNVIGITKECFSSHMNEYINSTGLKVYKLEERYFKHKLLRIENLENASRKARNRIKKIGNFGYFTRDRKTRWTDYIVGNYIIYSILHKITLKKVKKNYKREDIISIYKKLGVTDIFLCGYSNSGNKLFAINAEYMNIKIWITLNNWKDIYVNSFIPFYPSGVFTWNNDMKKEYIKRNTHLSSEKFIVTGNPAFDRFYNFKPNYSRDYYNKKYNLHENQPIFLYTLLAPDTYPFELETIKLIGKSIKDLYSDLPIKPTIVLRRNPLDTVNLDKTVLDESIIFAEHYFEGNKENGIIIQSIEGENEWLDLIYHSTLVINVASTVTLEALMLNKPVINIEFNGRGKNEPLLKKFTNAPFYTPMLERNDVKLARTVEDFEKVLKRFMETTNQKVEIPSVIGKFDGKASERIVKQINKGKK